MTKWVDLVEARELEDRSFSDSRVNWLSRLRWGATMAIVIAAFTAYIGWFPGLNIPVLLVVATGTAIFNATIRGRSGHHATAGTSHALFDMVVLTLVLWASGASRCPFVANYVFHVAIVGILGGVNATFWAAGVAVLGVVFLAVVDHVPAMQISSWNPIAPWDMFSDFTAMVGVIGAVAYLVSHAVGELRNRELALASASEAARLEYEVLSRTLDEMDAGLEVLDRDRTLLWRNKRAEQVSIGTPENQPWTCPGHQRPCQNNVGLPCPVDAAVDVGQRGRCRFAAHVDGDERVYEMLTFPLGKGNSNLGRVMNLYLDRTASVVEERGLLLAERLASLGRVTQGVAHDLNTPLATIQTLSTDLSEVLRSNVKLDDQKMRADLMESAELIRDETRRLSRITQGLLSGGAMAGAARRSLIPLSAIIERAKAVVFSGRPSVGVYIDLSVDPIEIDTDQDQLVQVLVNVLQNSLDAVENVERSTISISCERSVSRLAIVVLDNGPGFPPKLLETALEPFVTNKPPGRGTGLGLYTSQLVMEGLGGSISLANGASGGAKVSIELPFHPSPLVVLND